MRITMYAWLSEKYTTALSWEARSSTRNASENRLSAGLCQDPLGVHSAPIVGSGEDLTDGRGAKKEGKWREEETGKRGRTKREKGTRLHFFFPLPALAESLMRCVAVSLLSLFVKCPLTYIARILVCGMLCSCVLFLLHYHAECIVNIFIVFITVWLTFILHILHFKQLPHITCYVCDVWHLVTAW